VQDDVYDLPEVCIHLRKSVREEQKLERLLYVTGWMVNHSGPIEATNIMSKQKHLIHCIEKREAYNYLWHMENQE